MKFSGGFITGGLVLVTLAVSCEHLPSGYVSAGSVVVEVSLAPGLAKHWVSVEVNGETRFQSYLPATNGRVGPPASFSLDLPRGTHYLLVRWVPTDGDLPARIANNDIALSSSMAYDLGLVIAASSLQIAVRERRSADG